VLSPSCRASFARVVRLAGFATPDLCRTNHHAREHTLEDRDGALDVVFARGFAERETNNKTHAHLTNNGTDDGRGLRRARAARASARDAHAFEVERRDELRSLPSEHRHIRDVGKTACTVDGAAGCETEQRALETITQLGDERVDGG
jgi:hypothetical protein